MRLALGGRDTGCDPSPRSARSEGASGTSEGMPSNSPSIRGSFALNRTPLTPNSYEKFMGGDRLIYRGRGRLPQRIDTHY